MPISFIDKVFAPQVWARSFVSRFSPKVPMSSKFLIHHHWYRVPRTPRTQNPIEDTKMLTNVCATSAMLVLMFAVSANAPEPTRSSQPEEKEPYMKQLAVIKSRGVAGDAVGAVGNLQALSETLKREHASSLDRSRVLQKAMRLLIWSPVGKVDVVREAAAKIAMETVSGTRAEGVADPDVLQQQLELALDILPRTSAKPEDVAAPSLQIWEDIGAATARYHDLSNPKVPLEMPTPPPGYKGFFASGMDPSAITDPEYRRQYAEFLEKRDKFNQNYVKYRQCVDMREAFLPKLKAALTLAYSGDPEKEKAGAALIGKTVSDESMRAELLKAIQSTPAIRPSTK
jgi:hypothetical protein